MLGIETNPNIHIAVRIAILLQPDQVMLQSVDLKPDFSPFSEIQQR